MSRRLTGAGNAPSQRFFISSKVRVCRSPGKGRGVFTTAEVARGEVVEVAPVLLVPKEQAEDLLVSFLSHYMFSTDAGGRIVLGLGYTSLYNHSRRPNCDFTVTRARLTIRALRPITAGQEITVCYGWTAREWEQVGGRID